MDLMLIGGSMENKINFTVGPVQMDDETRKIGMNQIP